MIGMTMLKEYVNLSVPAVGFTFAIVLCFEMFTVETGHDIEFNLMLTTIKLSYRKVCKPCSNWKAFMSYALLQSIKTSTHSRFGKPLLKNVKIIQSNQSQAEKSNPGLAILNNLRKQT